jgi:hypothetical protein
VRSPWRLGAARDVLGPVGDHDQVAPGPRRLVEARRPKRVQPLAGVGEALPVAGGDPSTEAAANSGGRRGVVFATKDSVEVLEGVLHVSNQVGTLGSTRVLF